MKQRTRRKEGLSAGKQRKRRRYYGNHGIITVFVTLIMVPVVTITGLLVDVSRMKLYSSQALMAADSYGEAVLSEFDHLLKQLYGLFSVSQNPQGQAAIEKLREYAKYSFQPNGDGKGLSGFMPYADAAVELTHEKAEGASLSNNNVLMTQINDFMKYRIVEEVLEGAGILSSLEQFDHMSSDMDAVESRNDITNDSADALEKINDYYKELKKLEAYPDFLEERGNAVMNCKLALNDLVSSDLYKDYYAYLNSDEKEAIDNAHAKQERIAQAQENDEETEEELTPEEEALCEKYVDAVDFKKLVDGFDFPGLMKEVRNNKSDPIDFENAESTIDKLGQITTKLEGILGPLANKVKDLEGQLASCTEQLKNKIQEEIKDLEEIIHIADEFRATYQLLLVNKNEGLNALNEEQMTDAAETLGEWTESATACEWNPDEVFGDSLSDFSLEWHDFLPAKQTFYDQLKKLCATHGEDDGEADRQIKKANKQQEEAEKELNKDEETDARDISPELASQLKSNGASGSVPSLTDYFSGGLSFDALAAAGTDVISKFLLATYDFGMFSSRVSGKPPEGSAETDPGEYFDYSLTDVKMSKNVNYLYGAELEYLFGGRNSSVQNLNEIRNIICGVRLTINFISSYTIHEVNDAISSVANLAAGFGGPAAPLVRVAVSGALRLAFASIETVADWTSLKNREGVIFLKTDFDDLESLDALGSLLSLPAAGSESGTHDGFELTYENYMYILLVLLIDENTLLSRTSNLITLNVNQAMNEGDSLSTLSFKMEDTVTAIKSTCKVKADFVVVPDRFVEMFLSGSGTEAVVEKMEDHYYGYSIIRGY